MFKCTTVLLTLGTKLCHRSPKAAFCSQLLQVAYFRNFMQVESCSVCPSVAGLFHSAYCPPLSVCGEGARFPMLAIVNHVAVDTGTQRSVMIQISVLRDIYPEVGLLGALNPLRDLHTVFLNACTILHSQQQYPRKRVSRIPVETPLRRSFCLGKGTKIPSRCNQSGSEHPCPQQTPVCFFQWALPMSVSACMPPQMGRSLLSSWAPDSWTVWKAFLRKDMDLSFLRACAHCFQFSKAAWETEHLQMFQAHRALEEKGNEGSWRFDPLPALPSFQALPNAGHRLAPQPRFPGLPPPAAAS